MSLQEELPNDTIASGRSSFSVSTSSLGRRPSNFCRGLASLHATPAVRQHSLQSKLLGTPGFVRRLEQQSILTGHLGCVNTIAWDETGEYLVTGSDDLFLNIYRPLDPKPLVHRIRSGHRHNIFSAKFLTSTQASKIVSCAADGITRLTDVHRYVARSANDDWSPYPGYNCHTEITYEVMADVIDSHIFYDCADDGRIHRYDIRIRTSCDCEDQETCERHAFINVNSNSPAVRRSLFSSAFSPFRFSNKMLGITAITQRPENPVYIAAACSDDTVRIYDARMVGSQNHRDAQVYSYSPHIPPGYVVGSDGELKPGTNSDRSRLSTKITSLKYDPCGSGQLLVSYSRGDCYLIQPSWMGTKEEEKRRRGSLVTEERPSKNGRAQEDKNGKRRRSSDSPDNGADVVNLHKKSSPGAYPLEHAKHIALHKRSVQPGKAGLSESAGEGKGKDKGKGKGKGEENEEHVTEEEDEEQKRKVKADVEMDVDGDRATSSQANKDNKQDLSSQHSAPFKKSRSQNKQGSSSSAGVERERKSDAGGGAESEIETERETKNPVADIAADNEDEEHPSQSEDEHQRDDSVRISLSDVARFRGWGEAVSDDTEDEPDSDDIDDDDKNTEIGKPDATVKEDKIYWTKRSYRTGRMDTVQIYGGHRNARTMIKEANFYGPNSEFVMSGSDDGRIFFWDKMTGKVENAVPGDKQVVNCIQPHPLSRMLLAASGIDKTIKIFMPTAKERTDLSKIRGVRKPKDDHDAERRILHGAKPMPFSADTTLEDEETTALGGHNKTQDSTLSVSRHPENELDPQHAFDTYERGSDDGSDVLFSSDDDDDDDDDDGSDADNFLGNLPARYVLQIITELARASQRASARHATEEGNAQEEDGDSETTDGNQEEGEEEDGDSMALG